MEFPSSQKAEMGVAKEASIFWILVKLEVPGRVALGHTGQSRSIWDADSTLVLRNIIPPSCVGSCGCP